MSLDFERARKILEMAYKQACMLDENYKAPELADFVDCILDNTHKTYKYILVTALLAKATDENINPLALQAGAPISGAYDARSLCHAVVVKFENAYLGRALGGSNEPFLNKPARNTHLDKSNPVRRGNDQMLLYLLCDNLPLVTSNNAFLLLVHAMKNLILKKQELEKVSQIVRKNNNSFGDVLNFIESAVMENHEGETSALLVGAIYDLYMQQFGDYYVNVNPVNQAGTSSNEISDVDVYKNQMLYMTNEVKDKGFRTTDVMHAVNKVVNSGFDRMYFVKGVNGVLEDGIELEIESKYRNENFLLRFISVVELANTLLPLCSNVTVEQFWNSISQNMLKKKFKERTIQYFVNLAERFGWK